MLPLEAADGIVECETNKFYVLKRDAGVDG